LADEGRPYARESKECTRGGEDTQEHCAGENGIASANNEYMNNQQTNKRILEGVVVSAKMAKTAVVVVTRWKKSPKYQKHYKVTARFKAHNEDNRYREGEYVRIAATRPLSREKRWTIIGVVTKPTKQES